MMLFLRTLTVLPLLLTPALGFINVYLYSGQNCGGTQWSPGTRPSRSCTSLGTNIASGKTYQNSNSDCLYTYYGSNCEPETLVAIQDGNAPCGNYWGTVRSAKTASC